MGDCDQYNVMVHVYEYNVDFRCMEIFISMSKLKMNVTLICYNGTMYCVVFENLYNLQLQTFSMSYCDIFFSSKFITSSECLDEYAHFHHTNVIQLYDSLITFGALYYTGSYLCRTIYSITNTTNTIFISNIRQTTNR